MIQAKRLLISIFGAACLLFVTFNAQALPITVSGGESLVFNFDLTEYGTGPFTNTGASFSFIPVAQTIGTVATYSGLDATGTEYDALPIKDIFTGVSVPASSITGIFSALLTVHTGSLYVTEVFGYGRDAAGNVVIDNVQIPEPASFLLLCLGLVSITIFRLKQVV